MVSPQNTVHPLNAFPRALRPPEAVRKRPGMYIGDTGNRGLHRCAVDLIDNAENEAVAGFCDRIEVEINIDGSLTVSDNGRGIDVSLDPQSGVSNATLVMTDLPSSANRISSIGQPMLWIVNALASEMELSVVQHNVSWCQRFSEGVPLSDPILTPTDKPSGTTLRFLPDNTIFNDNDATTFDRAALRTYLQMLACFTPGLKTSLVDHRVQPSMLAQFHARSFVDILDLYSVNCGKVVTATMFMEKTFDTPQGQAHARIAMRLHQSREGALTTFVNNEHTPPTESWNAGDQEAYQEGFLNALLAYQRQCAPEEEPFLKTDLQEGLVSTIHVQMENPQFKDATRSALDNPELGVALKRAVTQVMAKAFCQNPALGNAWLANARRARHIRLNSPCFEF